MRLDKLLSASGFGSRKEMKLLLRSGAVSVNGKTQKFADFQVDPSTDEIYVNGAHLVYNPYAYLMLNKPAGVVSATYDNRDQTVLSLVPEAYQHYELFPVGRLDKDTEGLLLLTNDGALAHFLLSPKRHVPKRYTALLDRPACEADVLLFRQGILLDDGQKTLPAELILSEEPGRAEVVLHEGKFHQVKRMFAAVGKKVIYLKRISFGPLCLDASLLPGELRELTAEEIQALKDAVNG